MTKDDTPVEKQHFRHWVELRDLRDDTVRELPITVFQRIVLVEKKTGAASKHEWLVMEARLGEEAETLEHRAVAKLLGILD
jgi:hypothetical protein